MTTRKLTLTTWNVENLFRPARSETARWKEYRAKLAYLAKSIRELEADLVAMQEVGSEEALADLQEAIGGEYPHRGYGEQDGRGIACACLSALPFAAEPAHIAGFPPEVLELGITDTHGAPLTRMGRPALVVRVEKLGFVVDVVIAHLKSKLLTFNGAFTTTDETLRARTAALALVRRTAEAATLRAAANARVANDNGVAIAMVGDFNDGPDAATTQMLQGPGGSELGTRGFAAADPGDRARLWNLAALIPQERRYSRIHRGQGELLDQILVSEEFFHDSGGKLRRLPVSVDSRVENIRSIGDNPNAEPPSISPDHAPVTAVFEIPRRRRKRRRTRT